MAADSNKHHNSISSFAEIEQLSAMEIVKHYHAHSKHSFYGYAPGPETLDWDGQPNPFRSFEGSFSIPLPLDINQPSVDYYALLATEPAQHHAVDIRSIAALLRYALGLSAWKQYGSDRWSLRVNPSSGNLHPTEAYLLFFEDYAGIPAGLYHYDVQFHRLEKRADIDNMNSDSDSFARNSFYLALTSVPWRELWKYGERGFRYTQLDTGHAIAALAFSARALGWQLFMLEGVGSEKLTQMLGLNRPEYDGVEGEISECLLWLGPQLATSLALNEIPTELPALKDWAGVPARLGERSFYQWSWADQVAKATACSDSNAGFNAIPVLSDQTALLDHPRLDAMVDPGDEIPSFQQLVLWRRSAQAFDKSSINLQQFTLLLRSLLRFSQPLCLSQPAINFVVMVHRVEGLAPGFYVMPAEAGQQRRLATACDKWPDWHAMIELGETTLYQLKVANVQKAAVTLCCQQAIASDGVCTIGFLSDFDRSLELQGGGVYRQLYWQAGMLSQQLYLQATALDLAATGIGCFFDDPWHGFLGDASSAMQMLYLTAVGKPIVDERISSFSGYYHLQQRLI